MRPSPWASAMAQLLVAHPNQAVFRPPPLGDFVHRVGALYQGHDIEVSINTLEEAKARALELPNCAGFTAHTHAPSFEGAKVCFFKDRRDGNNDWRWQTWLKTDWTGADPPPTEWRGNVHDHEHDDRL